MAKPSDILSREYGFFHANSKTLTKEGQYTFESEFAAGHVLLMKDILAEEIPYFASQTELDTWMTEHPGILKKYDKVPLTQVKSSITGQPITDQQSWYIEDDGVWMKPIIVGTLASDKTTNTPSSILDPVLYKEDNSVVPSTQGVWWVDPFQGLLRFGAGYEPSKASAYGGTAIGIPKLTCYVYTGKKLLDVLSEQIQNKNHIYIAQENKILHTIQHNLNSENLLHSIYELNEDTNKWNSSIANIEFDSPNSCTVDLAREQKIKVVLRKID